MCASVNLSHFEQMGDPLSPFCNTVSMLRVFFSGYIKWPIKTCSSNYETKSLHQDLEGLRYILLQRCLSSSKSIILFANLFLLIFA